MLHHVHLLNDLQLGTVELAELIRKRGNVLFYEFNEMLMLRYYPDIIITE